MDGAPGGERGKMWDKQLPDPGASLFVLNELVCFPTHAAKTPHGWGTRHRMDRAPGEWVGYSRHFVLQHTDRLNRDPYTVPVLKRERTWRHNPGAGHQEHAGREAVVAE